MIHLHKNSFNSLNFFSDVNYKSLIIEETPQQSPGQSSPIFSIQKRPAVHSQGRIRWHLHLVTVSVSLHFQLKGFPVPALVHLLSNLCEASLPKVCPVFPSACVKFLHSQHHLKSCKSCLWHEESPPFILNPSPSSFISPQIILTEEAVHLLISSNEECFHPWQATNYCLILFFNQVNWMYSKDGSDINYFLV